VKSVAVNRVSDMNERIALVSCVVL
jgi:hypothetical protein